jgi:ribosomal protein S21
LHKNRKQWQNNLAYFLKEKMIYAVRKRNENNEKLMRRFKKQVQKEGIVKKIRQDRYFSPDKTKARVRQEAVKREEYRAEKVKRILMS